MASKVKRQRLIEDMTERYKRLGTYRAVASELGEGISFSLVQQVVEYGAWSPTLARAAGIEKSRSKLSGDVPKYIRKEIREHFRAIDPNMTNGTMIELMWLFWKNFHNEETSHDI